MVFKAQDFLITPLPPPFSGRQDGDSGEYGDDSDEYGGDSDADSVLDDGNDEDGDDEDGGEDGGEDGDEDGGEGSDETLQILVDGRSTCSYNMNCTLFLKTVS